MARAVGLHLPVFKFVNFKLKVPGPRLPHRLAALALRGLYIRDI